MKKLRQLLGLCVHKWRVIERQNVFEDGYSEKPYKIKYVLQCEHCGNIKTKN